VIRFDRWVYPEEDYSDYPFDYPRRHVFTSLAEMTATRDNYFLQREMREQTQLTDAEINQRYPLYGNYKALLETGEFNFSYFGYMGSITGYIDSKLTSIPGTYPLYTEAFYHARKQARAGGMTEEEINQQHPLGRDPDYYDYYYPNKPPTRDTIREHLERMIQPFRDQGLSETEARKAAQQQFNEYLDSDRFREWRRQWYEKVKK